MTKRQVMKFRESPYCHYKLFVAATAINRLISPYINLLLYGRLRVAYCMIVKDTIYWFSEFFFLVSLDPLFWRLGSTAVPG